MDVDEQVEGRKQINVAMDRTLTQVDGEGAPLRGRGVEVAVFDVEIPRGHRLGAKAVEESHFGP